MKVTKKMALCALASTLAVTSAVAAYYPSHYVERIYYETSAKRNTVGDSTLFCNGSYYKSGTITSHYDELRFPCRSEEP